MTLAEAVTRLSNWPDEWRSIVPVPTRTHPEPMGCTRSYRQELDLFPVIGATMLSLAERLYSAVTDEDIAQGLIRYMKLCRAGVFGTGAFEREAQRIWKLAGGPTDKN